MEVQDGEKVQINELDLEFAPSTHSVDNLAVRIRSDLKSVSYSGDGMFTDATMQLYSGTDLLIHEAYSMEPEYLNHACVREVVAMAQKVGVKNLAITHLKESLRWDKARVLEYLENETSIHAFLPEPLDTFELS